MDGFIKLARNILDWEWWDDINTYRLFTYMLLIANWQDKKYKGIDVPRGSFVSSIARLSDATKLTVDEVRTAIKHLKSTGEITSTSHSKFTVFTIKNYCVYQGNPEQDTEQAPICPQAVPTLFPTIEESKKVRMKEIYTHACACARKGQSTGFTNFQEREYNFDVLEDLILQTQEERSSYEN